MGNWNLPPEGGHFDKPSKIYFQTMGKKEVEERLKKDDILIIPIGSTENHGNAGPYGEDTFRRPGTRSRRRCRTRALLALAREAPSSRP